MNKKIKTILMFFMLFATMFNISASAEVETITVSNADSHIQGYIYDVNHIPIEGVRVVTGIFPTGDDVVESITDSSGYYKLDVKGDATYILEAKKEGYSTRLYGLLYVLIDRPYHVDMVLKEPYEIDGFVEGYVKDRGGNPVNGAKIYPLSGDAVTTDAQGFYKVPAFANYLNTIKMVDVATSGQEISKKRYVHKGETTRCDFTLIDLKIMNKEPGFLEGRIRDTEGKPINAAKLTFTNNLQQKIGEAYTNDEGKYNITIEGNTFYYIYVTNNAYIDCYTLMEYVYPAETTNVDFTLSKKTKLGRIEGQVYNRQGKALSNILVTAAASESSDFFFNTQTDKDGHYSMDVYGGYEYAVLVTYNIGKIYMNLYHFMYIFEEESTQNDFCIPKVKIDSSEMTKDVIVEQKILLKVTSLFDLFRDKIQEKIMLVQKSSKTFFGLKALGKNIYFSPFFNI